MASRSGFAPHVIAYWLMSASIARLAASLISAGAAKSGKPCARLVALCLSARRVMSRMTLSVNDAALLLISGTDVLLALGCERAREHRAQLLDDLVARGEVNGAHAQCARPVDVDGNVVDERGLVRFDGEAFTRQRVDRRIRLPHPHFGRVDDAVEDVRAHHLAPVVPLLDVVRQDRGLVV